MTRKKPNCSLILSGARIPAIQRSIGLKVIVGAKVRFREAGSRSAILEACATDLPFRNPTAKRAIGPIPA